MGRGFDFEVHWRGSQCPIRVIDRGPHFFHRQHGKTHVSREPLAYVEFDANDGPWNCAVRWSDLHAAGVAIAVQVPQRALEHGIT
jgi:hypothetical protein